MTVYPSKIRFIFIMQYSKKWILDWERKKKKAQKC